MNLASHSRYDKREDIHPGHPAMRTYSHIIMEVNISSIRLLQDTHPALVFIPGYDHVVFTPTQLPPFKVHLRDKVVILQSKDFTAGQWREITGLKVDFFPTPKTFDQRLHLTIFPEILQKSYFEWPTTWNIRWHNTEIWRCSGRTLILPESAVQPDLQVWVQLRYKDIHRPANLRSYLVSFQTSSREICKWNVKPAMFTLKLVKLVCYVSCFVE